MPHRPPSFEFTRAQLREKLPRPVLETEPGLVEMYWRTWELLHIGEGTEENGFSRFYLDEAFGWGIWQWDTCFMVLFSRYGHHLYPTSDSLDNFYRRQEEDGHIPGIFNGDGSRQAPSKDSDWSIMPPLFAWTEWEHYRITGDTDRLGKVLPILSRYLAWVKANKRLPNGLYYSSGYGTGMDNSPRGFGPETGEGVGVVCLAAQQALSALCLRNMAEVLGDAKGRREMEEEYRFHAEMVETRHWNPALSLYTDVAADGGLSEVKTVASFWPLLAGIPGPERRESLLAHLTDEKEFWRPQVFPTLSADHPDYNPKGGYWRGSVWHPTNYMVLRGLIAAGQRELAHRASLRHLRAVHRDFATSGTIYENYAPEQDGPGNQSKRDFVGWGGTGPIALLIESVLGFEVEAPKGEVAWDIRRTDAHGVENLRCGGNTVSLLAEARPEGGLPRLQVEAARPFRLTVTCEGREFAQGFAAGSHRWMPAAGEAASEGAPQGLSRKASA